jgi:hypothetical protein
LDCHRPFICSVAHYNVCFSVAFYLNMEVLAYRYKI